MDGDYRKTLRENVLAALKQAGYMIKKPPERRPYLGGTKKGKKLSQRSIQYMTDKRPDSPSPSLDALAALAASLGLQPWQLLVPGFDPSNPPVLPATPAERRLYEDFKRLRREIAETPD